jgi:26S proteasome regulatory subunit T3
VTSFFTNDGNYEQELKRIQSVPLVIGQFNEMVDTNYAVVSSTSGSTYYVRVLSTLDREQLKPNTSIALHRHSHAVVDILPPESDSSIQILTERPDVTYHDIGGMDIQKQEIREAVELPLTQFELYKQIGIDPPRGVLLYGPPGTGKTMMAKAVANATTAAFITMVGSEFVQKYLGEGPRMVRDVFRLARENSPAIVFIDEIDAVATKRFDAQTGADREVHHQVNCLSTVNHVSILNVFAPGSKNFVGVADSDGWFRSANQREGHHGH